MKTRKVIKEIDDIVLHIDGIVENLQSAATKLRAARSNVEKDKSVDKTLAAIKEAHLSVKKVLNGTDT